MNSVYKSELRKDDKYFEKLAWVIVNKTKG